MTRPDMDAIRARLLSPNLTAEEFESIMAILSCIEERESPTAYTVGETEWAHRIATLEHMLGEERENVDTLRAAVEHAEQRFVDEYDARKAAERERDEALARLPVDGSNMPSIVDTLEDDNAALRAEIAELKARITTLETMR